MVDKLKIKVDHKSIYYQLGSTLRKVETKSIGGYTGIYMLPNLYNKLITGKEYILYLVKDTDKDFVGFEKEFQAIIFESLLDIKGIGSIKALQIMRIFIPYHSITRSLNYLQKIKLTDYHGINQVLADRINKKFIKMWEEGILDD